MNEDDEIVQAFVEESHENLDRLDRDLVDLEAQPADPDLLASVFRTVHTIKGTCGFLGFGRLEALTHAGESLLGAVRDGDLALDAAITTSLLSLIDAVRAVMDRIHSTGAEGDEDHREVITDLNAHLAPRASVESVAPLTEPVDEPMGEAAWASSPVSPPLTSPHVAGAPVAAPAAATAAETSVRIDVTVLDKLLNLVGELVLASSQVGELAKDLPDGPLSVPSRQLDLVTNELQTCVMEARLQPVGLVTSKFRRIARDLAISLGKHVVVDLEGEDVGVDKAVNEALRDPLLHLVRNAIDHGLESPPLREAAGKPVDGRLSIRTSHENGRVQVEVADDGNGIDASRVVQKAVSIGILTSEEAHGLSHAEALRLIFHPGLSTKEEVSSVSGRGVGMDAVRASLEAVGGNIDVSSEQGKGTVFKITVPLTLSIMPVLIIWCGNQRYAIPQVDVEEVVHLDAADVAATLDHIRGARIHTLRGCLLPLVELAGELGVVPAHDEGSLEFVVVETEGQRFGLVVDSVGDAVGAVVKPLTAATRAIPLFGGVTILGDGGLSLILDMGGLAVAAGLETRLAVAAGLETRLAETMSPAPPLPQSDGKSVLQVTASDGTHFAVRLGLVDRLEHFPRASIERAGGMNVVQYRHGILPLLRLDELLPLHDATQLGDPHTATAEVIHAVVCDSVAGLVGLVVEGIEDIVPEPLALPQPVNRRGVSASLIIDERLTELLDIDVLVADAGLGVPA